MNAHQISGMLTFLVGTCKESIGATIGNRSLELAGYQDKMSGKSKMTIGEAQRIIQRCMRRSC